MGNVKKSPEHFILIVYFQNSAELAGLQMILRKSDSEPVNFSVNI